jgi:hypothetical protein
VSVYGPCHGVERDNFVAWLFNLNIPVDENWLLVGDFNFIRSQEDRNKPGGDLNDMFLFNEVIGHLGLLELQLKGRKFTWSNMLEIPLLEQLDWFFTSSNWISVLPNTMVLPLAKTGSDHVPCVVSIDTNIPKAKLFRFENYWVQLPGFIEALFTSKVFEGMGGDYFKSRNFPNRLFTSPCFEGIILGYPHKSPPL